MKKKFKVLRIILFVTLITSICITVFIQINTLNAATGTKSQEYVKAMGDGWNLGNTFDGFDTGGDKGETSWGNPVVTKELLATIKKSGFESIRIPMTTTMRIGYSDTNYAIDTEFLNRYKEVVGWALDEGFYVMVNVHHDSWDWLRNWAGSTDAEEYKKYVRIWEQLSSTFKDFDDKLMFESINEPQFYSNEASNLYTINDAFYKIVRKSGGNNATRMLVLPTLNTDAASAEKCNALYEQIKSLNDENLIATFHYYSEWVYSANLGKTRFEEVLWDTTTPKTSLISTFDQVYNTFIANGIGVVCGEYGLLGFDKSDYCNEPGETLKFIEFMNYYAKEKDICLMLWDNGQHMDRIELQWKNPAFGDIVETSMTTRSSYATGLDRIFVENSTKSNDISLPLTLNGNTFSGIYNGNTPLNEGTDYTYSNSTVTIKGSYISNLITGSYGTKAELKFKFSAGVDWTEYIIYSASPELSSASGTKTNFAIPANFKGDILEKASSKNSSGSVASNNWWWEYLEYDSEFTADYNTNTIKLLAKYFDAIGNGTYNLTFTFYSGRVLNYTITKDGDNITGKPVGSSTISPTTSTSPTPSTTTSQVTTTSTNTTETPAATPSTTPSTTAASATPTTTNPPTTSSGTSNNEFAVAYKISNNWGNGANVDVTITNNGSNSISNWNLSWTFSGNQKISNLWCGKYTQTGANVTVTNESWNSNIQPGS